jgi:NCAIR mutase (PurE)-related protein
MNVANGVLDPGDAAVQLNQVSEGLESAAKSAMVSKANFPEVIWGQGKSASQLVASLQRIASTAGIAAATRVPPEVAAGVHWVGGWVGEWGREGKGRVACI